MSEREFEYYEDQKSSNLKECDQRVDPEWYTAMIQRERKRFELYKKRQAEQFLGKDLHAIVELLEDSRILTESEEEDKTSEDVEEALSSKRRKILVLI